VIHTILLAVMAGASLSWAQADGQGDIAPPAKAHPGLHDKVYLELQEMTQDEKGHTVIKCGPVGAGCVYDGATGKLYPGMPPAPILPPK
jgi:hypothetical protein